jgi:surface polysaccharide O-acyltransferase-like enzyme
MSKSKQKFLFADYVRVFATLAVIFLHCAGDILYKVEFIELPLRPNWAGNFEESASNVWHNLGLYYGHYSQWWISNIYDSAVRWCVPVFVMLSGALLLRPAKAESIPDFLSKRMMRVFIPFVFWIFIYTLYTNRGHIVNGTMPYWPDVFHNIFFEDAYFHLWFVPMILGLYFLLPIFRVFVKNATRYEIEYFLVFWFYISTIQVYANQFLIVKFIGWLAYIGYLVLGDYVNTYFIDEKTRKWTYRLGWASFFFTVWVTWQGSLHVGSFYQKLYEYLSPNVIFMAYAIFVWAKYYDWAGFSDRNRKIHRAVIWFSQLTFI